MAKLGKIYKISVSATVKFHVMARHHLATVGSLHAYAFPVEVFGVVGHRPVSGHNC